MSTNRWVNPVNNNLLRDAAGTLLPAGTLEIYEAGTSTPLAVYSDIAQTISLGSILTADAYGLLPDFHLPAGTQFKAIAKNSGGSTKWTRDYLYTVDSSADSRLDALESTVNALTGATYNGCVNGGMRVAIGTSATMTSSFTQGSVNKLFGRVTNVTAGTLTQGSDTAYGSGKFALFSGVSTSASAVVEAQIRIPAGEAGRFIDDAVVFSCLVKHDVGTNVNYTVTVKTPTTTADDFSALTTIGTSSATAVVTGTDTRLAFAVSDMGDCSKGIAIEVSASVGTITTKAFRITEAQLESGSVRTSFTEADYDVVYAAIAEDERATYAYYRGSIRQTVLSSAVDSSGYPTFITAGTGLSVNIAATATPITLTAANGYDANGAVDYLGRITSDTTISGLTDSATNYLYATIGASGSVTLGSTTVAPVYQMGGTYAVTSGLFTFNIQQMIGKVGDGVSATQAYRVYLGEAVTSGGNVTSVVNYALCGRYLSADTAVPSPASTLSFSHKIGVRQVDARLWLKNVSTEFGYSAGDIVEPVGYPTAGPNGPVCVQLSSSNSAQFTSGQAGTCGLLVQVASGGNAGLNMDPTTAKWNIYMEARRPW